MHGGGALGCGGACTRCRVTPTAYPRVHIQGFIYMLACHVRMHIHVCVCARACMGMGSSRQSSVCMRAGHAVCARDLCRSVCFPVLMSRNTLPSSAPALACNVKAGESCWCCSARLSPCLTTNHTNVRPQHGRAGAIARNSGRRNKEVSQPYTCRGPHAVEILCKAVALIQ